MRQDIRKKSVHRRRKRKWEPPCPKGLSLVCTGLSGESRPVFLGSDAGLLPKSNRVPLSQVYLFASTDDFSLFSFIQGYLVGILFWGDF